MIMRYAAVLLYKKTVRVFPVRGYLCSSSSAISLACAVSFISVFLTFLLCIITAVCDDRYTYVLTFCTAS